MGLFETVSSFENVSTALVDVALWGLDTGLSDRLFSDDVVQLGLNLDKVPKKVVHLTAGDEYRQNFSLTDINTSLHAQVGFELQLPGVHSDIGGGYAERDPRHPRRSLNKEVRRIHNAADKQHLIAEGWYTPNQFEPVFQVSTPATRSMKLPLPGPFGIPLIIPVPALQSHSLKLWEDGVRYLSNEYQYVSLYLMIGLATRGGRHEAMDFSPFKAEKGATYQVPGDLTGVRDDFDGQAKKLDGAATKQYIQCAPAKLKWLRNRYLHRSARLVTEHKIGMGGRDDAERAGHRRLVIHDDKPYEKPQDWAARLTHEKAVQAREAAAKAAAEVKAAAARAAAETKAVAGRAATRTGNAAAEAGGWVSDHARRLWNWRPWN